MSTLTVDPGSLVVFDPSDERVVVFDWDASNLAAGVSIAESTITITARKQRANALTKDEESMIGSNRKVQVRILATSASVGDRYRVSNRIVTDETPAQTKEQSFEVLVQNR